MTLPPAPLTIWCNSQWPEPAVRILRGGTQEHRLLMSDTPRFPGASPLPPDPDFLQADVALGQPTPEHVIASDRLKWIQVDSAGYTRYDRDDLRSALQSRNAVLTNSSSVYDEPCAQHLLAMMLSFARQLPASVLDQHTNHAWNGPARRARMFLLGSDQTVLVLGFGAIARRLVELLKPFGLNVIATRRSPRGDEPIPVYSEAQTDALLPTADHVVSILPESAGTVGFMTSGRLAKMKPTAFFYNIGRGTTVDQRALIHALADHRIAGASLDVTDPEPLPPDHPLWTAPRCHITPHTGGGHFNEFERLAAHFVANLRRFESGADLLNIIRRDL